MGGRGSYSTYRKREKFNTGNGRRGQKKPNPMDVDKFQGMTLQQIEEHIRRLSHEELFAIDGQGNVIAAYKGNSDSVAFHASLLNESGITVTHGHPKGAEGFGGTFSIKDIQNMAASNWREHRAAASGKNEYNYIMRRTAKTTRQNSRDLYNQIEHDKPFIEHKMRKVANSSSLSATQRRQAYVGVLDRYYSRMLPRYNFEYVSRKKQYEYNR